MEYVFNGKVITRNSVVIDGVTYARREFDNTPGIIPRKEWTTIDQDTQVIFPVAGHEVNGEWVNFDVRAKTPAELEEALMGKRASEYPPIGDQLDSLFHSGAFPAEMAAKIQAVKDKYPKN